MDAKQQIWVRSLEERIEALEMAHPYEIGRLWRYYRRLKLQYTRLYGRLPEGKAWERGSTLTIPPRPVRLLRDLGILKDDSR